MQNLLVRVFVESSLRIIRRSLLDAFGATQRIAANDGFTAKAARSADALAEEVPPPPSGGTVAVRMTAICCVGESKKSSTRPRTNWRKPKPGLPATWPARSRDTA